MIQARQNPGDELWDRNTRGDAFGEMIRAVYRHEPSFGLIERDDGLVEPHDPRMYLSAPHEWDLLDHRACARAMGRVLDVGCGAGRHAIFLQAKGYDVVGIDPSPGMCEVARSRGLRAVHEIAVEATESLHGETFDTILMLGGNLALIGSPRKASTVLTMLAELANPGARVLGVNRDPYATTDSTHMAYHVRNRARGRLPGQTRIRPRFRRLVGPWTELLLCSVEELRTLVASSAWTVGPVETHEDSYLVELRLAQVPAGSHSSANPANSANSANTTNSA